MTSVKNASLRLDFEMVIVFIQPESRGQAQQNFAKDTTEVFGGINARDLRQLKLGPQQ